MKALCLSGGGVKGAFEVGVLRKLFDTEAVDYQIYTGVSVGALNTSFLAAGKCLAETLPALEDIWLNQIKGNSSIWKHFLFKRLFWALLITLILAVFCFFTFIVSWPKLITIFSGLMCLASIYLPFRVVKYTQSVYDNAPLQKLVRSKLDIEKLYNSGKQLRVGAVSYEAGDYATGSQGNDIVNWVIASSAFPVFFPMQLIEKQHFTDGGVMNIAPLKDAIDLGADEIDVILASPISNIYNGPIPGVLSQAMRFLDLMATEILKNDLKICVATNDLVKYGIEPGKKIVKIRIFMPKENLIDDSLDFNPKKIREMYEIGRNTDPVDAIDVF
jgi:NTE family protein